MRNFILGVAVGAVGMGVYSGYIKVNLGENPEPTSTPSTPETTE